MAHNLKLNFLKNNNGANIFKVNFNFNYTQKSDAVCKIRYINGDKVRKSGFFCRSSVQQQSPTSEPEVSGRLRPVPRRRCERRRQPEPLPTTKPQVTNTSNRWRTCRSPWHEHGVQQVCSQKHFLMTPFPVRRKGPILGHL